MLNRKGYTIVEGIIAMLLVAIMVGAIFSALMASRRAIVEPSYREEMIYTVESLQNRIKNYVDADGSGLDSLCDSDPLSYEVHDCNSLLPDVCKSNSSLTYEVSEVSVSDSSGAYNPKVNQIKIHMVCNGEVL